MGSDGDGLDTPTRWVDVNGIRVHCLTAGGTGSTVVLLHGGGIDSASFTYGHLIGTLAERHRVFAPDWPGYGHSDKPDVDYATRFYVDFLGRLMDALALERASLVGTSMGGGAALGFALRSPQRVEKLVLVDSYGLGYEVPWVRLGSLMVLAPLVDKLTLRLEAHFLRDSREGLGAATARGRSKTGPRSVDWRRTAGRAPPSSWRVPPPRPCRGRG
jgi:pimeloyl-ACP methyl ester carboxylesterase